MTIPTFSPLMLLALVPQVSLVLLAGLILIVDAAGRRRRKSALGWLTVGGLLVILVLTLALSRPQEGQDLILGGMLRHDWMAFAFTLVFLFAAGVAALLSIDTPRVGGKGEYYSLLVVGALGMSLMASAADLIMLYLAIETTSLSLYVLAGFLKGDDKSAESGIKYFLFGAMSSAVMLYGFSLLYGLSGETNLYLISAKLQAGVVPALPLAGVAMLILVGLAFKVAAVPFHFWTPDVYEGAPTPITAYISTGSKAAGFAVLLRVMLAAFPVAEPYWSAVLASMAVATMTLGNLLALTQSNIKRLLAYSSIAHAGYALVGVVALSEFGAASAVFYLIAYVVTNLAAFAVVLLVAGNTGSEQIADYAGLSRRSPGLALALLVALLSLAGMPPLAGFVAKFYVFASAVQSGMVWLAFVGVLNAIVGLYYYLTVLKVVYLYPSEEENKPLRLARTQAIALVGCVAAIVVIGVVSGPWLGWAIRAVQSMGLF